MQYFSPLRMELLPYKTLTAKQRLYCSSHPSRKGTFFWQREFFFSLSSSHQPAHVAVFTVDHPWVGSLFTFSRQFSYGSEFIASGASPLWLSSPPQACFKKKKCSKKQKVGTKLILFCHPRWNLCCNGTSRLMFMLMFPSVHVGVAAAVRFATRCRCCDFQPLHMCEETPSRPSITIHHLRIMNSAHASVFSEPWARPIEA